MDAFVHELHGGRVVFGPGASASVGEEVRRLGATSVLLIADQTVADLASVMESQLGALVRATIGQVHQHVPQEAAAAAAALAGEHAVDVVVCVGGGSATGLAKAVALQVPVRIVAVPTTYAGSEMTPVWGTTTEQRKATGRDPRVLPVAVVYDPVLTRTMPWSMTVTSGLNAVAHAVEALWSVDASPVVRLMAQEASRAMVDAITVLESAPDDLGARGDALYGAWLAGMSLGNSSMAVHHKLCHVLGGMFGLHHSTTHAVLLPYVLGFNLPFAPNAARRLAQAWGSGDPATTLWDLGRRWGVPAGLSTQGLKRSDVPRVVAEVLSGQFVNPRPLTAQDLGRMLLSAVDGRPPSVDTSKG